MIVTCICTIYFTWIPTIVVMYERMYVCVYICSEVSVAASLSIESEQCDVLEPMRKSPVAPLMNILSHLMSLCMI